MVKGKEPEHKYSHHHYCTLH